MNNKILYLALIFEVLMVLVGVVEDFSDDKWQYLELPKGMGITISMIAITMMAFLFKLIQENGERSNGWGELKKDFEYCKMLAQKGGYCTAVHEREFYFLWEHQFKEAKNNIDISHMGDIPPRNLSEPQTKYFSKMKTNIKRINCNVRRVERLTSAKISWVNEIYKNFENQSNFSLSIIIEDNFIPISLSRVDDKYAWIVALSEGESSLNFRDILITDKNVIAILITFYENKIWKKSIKLIKNGQKTGNWEKIMEKINEGVDMNNISIEYR